MPDPRDIYFSSEIPIDKILGTFEGSFSIGTGSPFAEVNDTFVTNIPETTFYQGIYSTDGGTTWIDLGSYIGRTTDITVIGISSLGSFTIKSRNFGASGFDVQYKVALIAKPGQGSITPQPIGDDIVFNTEFNYQKILSDESSSISVANGSDYIETIPHNLGYIPKVRAFIEIPSSFGSYTTAGLYEFLTFANASLSQTTSPDASAEHKSGVYLDNSNVYVGIGNKAGVGTLNGTLYVRTYYDA